jgi:hypothetical protein
VRRRDDFWTYITDEDYKTAKRNGIEAKTVCSRVDAGWSVEKAINTSVRKQSEEYHRFRKRAKENGVKDSTYRSRVQRGWSPEKASSEPLVPPEMSGGRAYTTKKRVVPECLVVMARENGISYSALYRRLARWTCPTECATIPMFTNREGMRKELLRRNRYVK